LRELTPALVRQHPSAATFVELADGLTHYELRGPEDGAPIVLVCGLTSPLFVWDHTAAALAEAGHRVLRYDLYGRGLSLRTGGTYDLELYVRQLDEITRAVLGEEPMTLLAYSWGAGFGSLFAARHPQRIRQLILQAPGGLSWAHALALLWFRVPLLGEAIVATVGDRLLLADLRKCFTEPSAQGGYFERFRHQLGFRGFREAFLGTARHVPADLRACYRGLADHRWPVRVLWGSDDRKVPIRFAGALQAALPTAELVTVEGGSHGMQFEQPERFTRHLQALLT